jgi:hypothetical protein
MYMYIDDEINRPGRTEGSIERRLVFRDWADGIEVWHASGPSLRINHSHLPSLPAILVI